MNSSAEGNALSEARYLDTHYEAAKEIYEECARYADFQKGWSILDAGAGGGSFIPLISEILGSKGRITAIDIDESNIAMIHERQAAGQFNCPVETHNASVTDLPFDDNSFDAIWCANVQQYLTEDELATALSEFKRVVRPLGIIAIKDADVACTQAGTNTEASWHFVQGMFTLPEFSLMAKGWTRIPRMPSFYRKHGIEALRYKTTLVEWQYPVAEFARPYVESSLTSIGYIATLLNLSEEESAYWKQFADVNAPDFIMNNPDYYHREAHGIAIGRKPA